MATGDSRTSDQSLNQEVRRIWEGNAAFWDEKMGPDGNNFQRLLIGPATERLLDLQAGDFVLDIGCGSGVFSRRLAALGARVLAFDFSASFIDRARARTTLHADRLDYRVLDATDSAALLALGNQQFDAAVCTMAFMDMSSLDPLSDTLGHLLKPNGRFVFSVTHPCFNSTGSQLLVEEGYRDDGTLTAVFSVKVTGYLRNPPRKGIGIVGQPEPHYYFDRPLHALFSTFFRRGFVLDGLEEPAFEEGMAKAGLSWNNYTEIPPVLVGRLRKPNA